MTDYADAGAAVAADGGSSSSGRRREGSPRRKDTRRPRAIWSKEGPWRHRGATRLQRGGHGQLLRCFKGVQKDFKINVGESTSKYTLSSSSLEHQIESGLGTGYTEFEIVVAVIRAVKPGLKLRSYLEGVGKKRVWLLAGSEERRRRRDGRCRHKKPRLYSVTKS